MAKDHQFVDLPPVPDRTEDPTVMYGRLVVAGVVAIVVTLGAFAAAIGFAFAGSQRPDIGAPVRIGQYTTFVSLEVPTAELVLVGLLGIVLIAATAIAFETIAAVLSISPRHRLLSSYRGGPNLAPSDDTVRVTVLVPAHNEEVSLPVTLNALRAQTRAPDRVIVVADNCTDRTVQIAREAGADVVETVGNTGKKGGALNQALTAILRETDARDAILVMDADTLPSPRFVQVAAARLEADPELTAVGGVFYGEDGHGLVGQFQRNEYARYSMQIRMRHGRVFVLTGTATMFRAQALLDVAAARGIFIPGETGMVYDTAALTEDNELTLALKSLGGTMTSPRECTVTTELMPTWKHLWIQRERWQRGALENLSAYGITPATVRYWGQQVGIAYGVIALNLALALMAITFLAVDRWIWFPFWLAVGSIFVIERVATVWSGGWKARLLALLLFPELAYDLFLQAVFCKCLFDITLARRARWGHVRHRTRLVAT
ncbi:glycosyltransferase family 2 protein [Mycobacterium sp. B14F4]|uniref:glycosyltransferase family 2 protein n=1 Tax=Mycobacterium sp. B14F4 TaxID=3153565 RepID=UPI00325E0A89